VKIIYVVVIVYFLLLHTSYARNRGMCYTTKCDTVEDGLVKCASEGNSGGGVRKLTRRYRVTQVMSREMGNLVEKVDVKENMGEGLMMTNIELVEA
jgi:hypothetical protein